MQSLDEAIRLFPTNSLHIDPLGASDFLMSARFSPFWRIWAKTVRPLLSIVCGLTVFAQMRQNHQKSG